MTDDRWRRIERIFAEAQLQRAGERPAFLACACGTDADLRREVESLLAHDNSEDGFLERPAIGVLTSPDRVASGELVGRAFGAYRILSVLGVGGMGEVYLAADPKLGRDVAVKVLPSQWTSNPERRARFEREARVLATFSDSHIGAIYGLEECEGRQALVLEYVPGDTLADRIRRGPMPVTAALGIAGQIAAALDSAHGKGVVHRDLKPANVKVSSDGRVKVLDFGLAKMAAEPRSSRDIGDHSPLTQATEAGRLLGTPQYMSPEQARGEVVDKRADIWAFGCVLYEMLAACPAMTGDTVAEVMASILERPPDWTRLPATTPSAIRRLLQRCLEKDPTRRLRDIGDARLDLEDAQVAGSDAAPPTTRRPGTRVRRSVVVAALAILVVAAGVGFTLVSQQSAALPARPIDLTITAPPGLTLERLAGIAVSPDASAVAFVAGSRLWLRSLSEQTPHELPGTSGATAPFWSPDGHAIGFVAGGTLRTIRIDDAVPVDVVPSIPVARGATWGTDGSILFGTDSGPIRRVRPGEPPVAITTLQPGDTGHRWPSMLPDGDHFLYFVARAQGNELRVGSVSSGTTTSLGPSQSNAIYSAGRLLFLQRGNLMAQPFDAGLLTRTGPARLVAGPTTFNAWGLGGFSSSGAGVLAHIDSGTTRRQLTWMTRSGAAGKVGTPAQFFNLALSPDGRKLAASMLTGSPSNVDIWLIDLAREAAATRITSGTGMEFDPAWTPDGKTLLFTSNETGILQLRRQAATGEGNDEPMLDTDFGVSAPNVSPDGHDVVFSVGSAANAIDLWTMPLSVERTATMFLGTKANETSASFSPDGHWVVYQSTVSGDRQVYIRSFPAAAGQIPVSTNGGWAPEWSRDGKAVYFLDPRGTMMRVTTEARGGVMQVGLPEALFETELPPGNARPYAVAKDDRILVPLPDRTDRPDTITVMLNWVAKLAK